MYLLVIEKSYFLYISARFSCLVIVGVNCLNTQNSLKCISQMVKELNIPFLQLSGNVEWVFSLYCIGTIFYCGKVSVCDIR